MRKVMIILQKNENGPKSSNATLMAEIIAEFFDGKSIDQVFKLGGRSVPKALKILADLNLIRIDGDKIVLTDVGRDFVSLPYPEDHRKDEEAYFESS